VSIGTSCVKANAQLPFASRSYEFERYADVTRWRYSCVAFAEHCIPSRHVPLHELTIGSLGSPNVSLSLLMLEGTIHESRMLRDVGRTRPLGPEDFGDDSGALARPGRASRGSVACHCC
jgi:hypothetical protein